MTKSPQNPTPGSRKGKVSETIGYDDQNERGEKESEIEIDGKQYANSNYGQERQEDPAGRMEVPEPGRPAALVRTKVQK